MSALGDVSRQVPTEPARYALTIAGALGLGNDDFSRELPPIAGGGGGPPPDPGLPTYGQIFPSGR